MKKIDKILTHFGDALYKFLLFTIYFYQFFLARDVQLDNGVHPPGKNDDHVANEV